MTAVPPNNEQFIRQLLDESGVDTSLPLQAALLELRAAGTAPVPAPSGELAAFMAPAVARLRPRRRAIKGAVIGLAVAAATGLGVSGVAAANPQFQAATGQAVEQVIRFFAPAAGSAPAGQTPGDPVPAGDIDDQVRPTPTDAPGSPAATRTPAAPAQSPGPKDAGQDGSVGSRNPAAPPAHGQTAPAEGRRVLPPVPEVPVPSGVPGPDGEQPGEPGLKVPPIPRPTGPADLPHLPVLPDR
ncbi:hypothetical protein ACFQ36_01375 [Arthrobacter sp. GCM10027362]|uniref:hypothetical protein n=1 Tax=Arthrobacter sp. GCM10027362 TaxID=3273379 RepID=UPI00363FE2D3